MLRRQLSICFAATIALAAQTANAQVRGLPEEAAARAAADALLEGRINQEIVDRMAADEELRASIGGETTIVGRYAFTGTGSCLSSSTGFRTDFEFEPVLVFPQPPLPNQPPVMGSVIQMNSNTVTGVRTFHPDGTGTSVVTFQSINHPSTLTQIRTGGASISTFEGTFTYMVDGDNLIIDDEPQIGFVTKGGRSVGAQISVLGVPRFVGKISKDRKTISLTQEDMVVEQLVITPLVGQPTTTDRVCNRVRNLYRIN